MGCLTLSICSTKGFDVTKSDSNGHAVAISQSHNSTHKIAGTPKKNRIQPKEWLYKQAKSCFTVKTLRKRLPIINWLANYNVTAFQSDLIAGITVGLTVIPQGIAYANVAALPLQYGLYTAFMGCFMYCLLGSTREINIGPTAIIALLTAQQVKIGGPDYAVALCFICGCIELMFAIFNLGFLIDFISVPVISGFSSAAALIISATQLKGLLGIKFEEEKFALVIYKVFENISTTKIYDLILGITSLVILLVLRWFGRYKWKDPPGHVPTCGQRAWRKAVWLICTGRNALVVLVASVISYILTANDIKALTPSGSVPSGLPPFEFPPLSTTRPDNVTVTFPHMVEDLGSSLILIPLVSILEHIAIAKVFAQGKGVDAKQEFLALGVSNFLGSFVSSFPCTGSFSRTALNGSCGVKSPIGGLYTGILVVLALAFLAPFFKFIPKASLSAVIISAVIFMIEYEMVPHLWKTKKSELFVMAVTFICCLALSAEYGIIIGVVVSLFILLYYSARPKLTVEKALTPQTEYILIQPQQNMYFPAVEYLRNKVKRGVNKFGNITGVFDGSHFQNTDFTIGECLKQIVDDFKNRSQKIWFYNTSEDMVQMLHHMEIKEINQIASLDEIGGIIKDHKIQMESVLDSNGGKPWQPDMKDKEVVKLLSLQPSNLPYAQDGEILDNDNDLQTEILPDGHTKVFITSSSSEDPKHPPAHQ